MKIPNTKTLILTAVFLICLFGIQKTVYTQNTLNGMVTDQNRRPVVSVYVELLDEFERFVERVETSSSGFYAFRDIRSGSYFVSVTVAGTPYAEQRVRVSVGSVSLRRVAGGAVRTSREIKNQNIMLRLDPRYATKNPDKTGVLFVQEIPNDAEKAYLKGVANLKKKKHDDALRDFEKAILVFPEYFSALEALGKLRLDQNEYLKAESLLTKAAKINKNSFNSLWLLAVAQNKLNKKHDAIDTLNKANKLDSKSVNSHFLLGMIKRQIKQFSESEKSFLTAKKLSNDHVPAIYLNLALLYYHNLHRYEKAADALEQYLKSIPRKERSEQKEKIAQYRRLIKTFRNKAKLNKKAN